MRRRVLTHPWNWKHEAGKTWDGKNAVQKQGFRDGRFGAALVITLAIKVTPYSAEGRSEKGMSEDIPFSLISCGG